MTAVDVAAPVIGSLSPSRAADFLTCPLRYRFRVVDKLPERPSPAATRGTIVHSVLERLFDLPAAERTVGRATELLPQAWESLLADNPEVAEMFAAAVPNGRDTAVEPRVALPQQACETPSDGGFGEWMAGARTLLERYFTLENPQRLEPAERELLIETRLESGLLLRGYVDRLDVAPSGDMRIVDYKTGRAPSEAFEARALFQMRFYALVLWRLHGRVPRLLQLLYLGSGDVLRYEPDESDLRATERKLVALWRAIQRAHATGDWRPSPSRLCAWCDHRDAYCPAFGGTPPPLPPEPADVSAQSHALGSDAPGDDLDVGR